MAAALLVGMALGLWLELYRGHLRAARPRRLGLLIRDVTFWLGATAIAAFGLYLANWLDLRLYAMCCMALGILLSTSLAGPTVRPVAGAATRAAAALAQALLWPARALGRGRRGARSGAPRPPAAPPARRPGRRRESG